MAENGACVDQPLVDVSQPISHLAAHAEAVAGVDRSVITSLVETRLRLGRLESAFRLNGQREGKRGPLARLALDPDPPSYLYSSVDSNLNI
jgi:hypothetical protein